MKIMQNKFIFADIVLEMSAMKQKVFCRIMNCTAAFTAENMHI